MALKITAQEIREVMDVMGDTIKSMPQQTGLSRQEVYVATLTAALNRLADAVNLANDTICGSADNIAEAIDKTHTGAGRKE